MKIADHIRFAQVVLPCPDLAASLRFFNASPREPPNSPTPTNVTFCHRTRPVSGFDPRLSSF